MTCGDTESRSPPDSSRGAEPDALRPWYLYILECVDGSLYTGVAKDVEVRLRKHNSGKGARYTRSRIINWSAFAF